MDNYTLLEKSFKDDFTNSQKEIEEYLKGIPNSFDYTKLNEIHGIKLIKEDSVLKIETDGITFKVIVLIKGKYRLSDNILM